MEITNFIDFMINNSHNQVGGNLEFEVRFGKYDKISSNIKPHTFAKILELGTGSSTTTACCKKYTFIHESIYASGMKKRVTYKDDAGEIKKLFGKLSPGSTEGISLVQMQEVIDKCSRQKPIEEHCIKKDRVKKPISKPNYKIALVKEIITPSTPSESEPQATRYKMRCSWLDAMWMFDITIMMHQMGSAMQHTRSGTTDKIYYEAEIEYSQAVVDKHKYTREQIYECVAKNINTITTIIDCDATKFTNIDVELRHGIQNSVSTLERSDLNKLIRSKYSVVDKADGERKFIHIDSSGGVFHMNPTEIIMEKVLIAKNNKILCKDTLIDCELIDGNAFYGFDLLFYQNRDCRNLSLGERLGMLTKVMSALCGLRREPVHYTFKMKTFYMGDIFKNAGYIWNNRKKLFPYQLDGLIFTPVRGTYLGYLPNLKWKDKHSVDVRIFYNKHTDFTEFYPNASAIIRKGPSRGSSREPINNQHGDVINAYTVRTNSGEQKIYYKNRMVFHDSRYKNMGLVSRDGVLGMPGKIDLPNMIDIVEVEFLPDAKCWVFLRKREDKENPNSFLSIKSVLEAIVDHITIKELSSLKYRMSPYEKIGAEHNTCFTNIGFSLISAGNVSADAESLVNSRYAMCEFYAYCYKNMIAGGSKGGAGGSKGGAGGSKGGVGGSILVLGGDVCVLNALLESKYTNITIVEKNCLEIYGETESEGYMGLMQHLRNKPTDKNIHIVWGDCNIADGLSAYTRQGQTVLNKGIKSVWDLIFINSFETALFNHKSHKFDGTMYSKYMANLRKYLGVAMHDTSARSGAKTSAAPNVIGLFLSGGRIATHMEKSRCVIMRDAELNPLHKIYLDQKNIKEIEKKQSRTNIFETQHAADVVQMVEIQRLKNSFVAECQPLVFDSNVSDVLRQKNIKIDVCKPLKSFYAEFKREGGARLADYDCIMGDITKYFAATLV
jgi:hypothetical protein